MRLYRGFLVVAAFLPIVSLSLPFTATTAYAQETTAGLQGTVKDGTGAVLPNVAVTVSSPSLVGDKTTTTDKQGNYRFANLPPGPYVISTTAKGFSSLKRAGLILEVGHLPNVDLTLAVGGESTVVEVSAEAPLIDVTTTTTQTNITSDVINYVPRGTSFQSVIQFAPAARNEPLMGNTMTNGTGSTSPGNGSNGGSFGYSVAGGSDSENSYLVEGQETANLIGGYSHTNVPFDFIQEVQIKTSGIEAEHGGALGGVVNVIMKKGSSNYHGSLFAQFENNALDAGPNPTARYNPADPGTNTSWGFIDPAYQSYQGHSLHHSDFLPGFTLGGPLLPFMPRLRDRLFFFVAFNPDLNRQEVKVDYSGMGLGLLPFSRNTNTYYTTARVDAQVSKKIRLFGSWLYQLQRQNGQTLPFADSTKGLFNISTQSDPSLYAHTLGFDAPNLTVNTGADITLTNSIVSTTRFGYYFENYHDFGYPRGGVVYNFQTGGQGADDAFGNPIPPGQLYQNTGFQSGALNQITNYNASKAIQLDEAVSWFKSTSFGTHNFKFGYQLTRNSNIIDQLYNEPYVQVFAGSNSIYSPGGPVGDANCAAVEAQLNITDCQGQYGYVTLSDFGTAGHATAYDHGFFGQDSWTVGRGVTIDAGIRAEKEFLPGEAQGPGVNPKPINFNWKQKIAPRVGVAWDVFRNGKMKVFGDYGVFYDQMKLNLAISSFGGQYWNLCSYALNTQDLSSINASFNSGNRYCPSGDTSTPANFGGGHAPAGLTFLENLNNRANPTTCSTCSVQQEGVAPGLEPYRQHEAVMGVDYQINKTVAFEARYDRRRLDHVIEDAAIFNPLVGETFVIVNPGQGANSTFSGFCNFLYGPGAAGCALPDGTTAFPPNQTIPAARSYDGLELRVNKAMSNHWLGMVSYTYSHFRGNYTGLTSSDISDGGNGGRNAPNNSRAFDEPYFQYNSFGGSSSGLLPTDRPNTLKGYVYYQLGFLKRFTTDLGIFQTLYQGSPNTSYMNVGYSQGYPADVFSRGKWADVTQDPTTGAVTVGNVRTYRNPWYNQTDFNFQESYKLTESKSLSFSSTFTNVLNEHSVTAVNEQIDTSFQASNYVTPGGTYLGDGIPFYAAATSPYSVSDALNGRNNQSSLGSPITVNSQYGKPLYYQLPRTIRLQAKFTF
jgi:Carboxypeptidase regulatory-like domain